MKKETSTKKKAGNPKAFVPKKQQIKKPAKKSAKDQKTKSQQKAKKEKMETQKQTDKGKYIANRIGPNSLISTVNLGKTD